MLRIYPMLRTEPGEITLFLSLTDAVSCFTSILQHGPDELNSIDLSRYLELRAISCSYTPPKPAHLTW